MKTVYLIRMVSDGSICSIWTTEESANLAILYYEKKWGNGVVFKDEVPLDIINYGSSL